MTSEVVYNGDLRTTCTHLKSGSQIETDAPVDNNGKGERFSPTDLLATGLAACMLTVMGIKARSMDFDLNDIKIEVQKIMAENPRRVAGIDLKFHIPEHLIQLDPKTITILKNTAATCPVKKSLHPDVVINMDWGAWS
ncbi:osmotically inducible protein OsmC [Niabella ginsenosidivorans]|uniref:Osmotically inducible protein OsmC n=1 Tax=Niabella ginsenosidivorans TaxID=1176587 RepID=A0A1A9I6C9_9BACT|nr:OsmC family protein [Niabella ginsenosidivorans]ANH82094.1 osmotically inducible protein OsmC [Niabella ginsenosidivorans]